MKLHVKENNQAIAKKGYSQKLRDHDRIHMTPNDAEMQERQCRVKKVNLYELFTELMAQGY